MAISLICEVLHGRCFPKSNADISASTNSQWFSRYTTSEEKPKLKLVLNTSFDSCLKIFSKDFVPLKMEI
ncbi:hypothetical protein E4U35_006610 [Claviceps purpurea]|nr:hypothetical protein E4U38_000074 [Claviceps purpurea]KAG6186534.1 hypothetical protein E4U27_008371 [Claviceps purpurea]KAG6209790.1 hypothetical protein E4U35_006610 [Claviceps purpurea]KAG6245363.1 hypothetical protein E4U24_004452 [Claviceps purpurea]KAG6257120.1 hypothetical protein E4U23_007936 [Claviceps purpurea]